LRLVEIDDVKGTGAGIDERDAHGIDKGGASVMAKNTKEVGDGRG
jgi:hypothetical protein